MARASTPTLLALDRWAKIMGVPPAPFNTLTGTVVFPAGSQCNDVWWQYSWQKSDAVSREDLARAIYDAEQDTARVLNYYPAPAFIAKEVHNYPRHFRRDEYGTGLNNRGMFKSVKARWGRFVNAGRRGTTLIGTATVAGGTLVYSDPDGDGVNERVTITLATALTDACEIKVYFAGHSALPEWEIRPALTKSISGGNIVLTFDAWLFVDPDLWEVYPTVNGLNAIDIDTSGNYVTSVEVYREYTDFTQTSAEFFWEITPKGLLTVLCENCGGSGCVACELSTQTGCLHVRDVNNGIVVPQPATYDSVEATWTQDTWLTSNQCREPDQVKIWYYAGEIDDRYLAGQTCEPLSDYLAHAIAWMATARLERDFCSCGNLQALANDLRKDLAFSDDAGSYATTENILDNPFGTRKGEVMAWKRISKLTEVNLGMALA